MLLLSLVLAAAPMELKDLEAAEPSVRYAASRKLSAKGASVVPELTAALDSPRPLLRAMAAHALAGFGQQEQAKVAWSALPKLELLLVKDPDAKVRSSVARALGLLCRETPAPDTRKALTALAAALRDTDGEVRSSAAMALAVLDPTSADAAAELGAALQRPEPPGSNLHQEACLRLETMGAAAKRGVPGLVALLKSDDEDLRATALESLTKLGRHAVDAAPALEALAKKAQGAEAQSVSTALQAVRAKK